MSIVAVPRDGDSDDAHFRTPDCDNSFSIPGNLRADDLSGHTVRFQWDRGNDNQSFCVDTAQSDQDLHDMQGSWSNHGCGSTSTLLDVSNLQCGTDYYWRVYSCGSQRDGDSARVTSVRWPANAASV